MSNNFFSLTTLGLDSDELTDDQFQKLIDWLQKLIDFLKSLPDTPKTDELIVFIA